MDIEAFIILKRTLQIKRYYTLKLNKLFGIYLSSLYFDEDGLIKTVYFCSVIFDNLKCIIMTTDDVTRVYDTILSIPSMNETVKIDLRISRKNVLLLNSIIERGLSAKNTENTTNLINGASKENLQELKDIGSDCLQKAGLTELSEKLNALGTAK